jgi:hypothetical protein
MELNTYGDLKKTIKAISLGQKKEKIGNVALGALTSFLPGADAAKTTFDFVRAAFSKPDTKKTKTWIDKIDVDDKFSAIVDDTIENAFLKVISQTFDNEPDNKPLEDDFNMNQKLVDYLKGNFGGRTVTGIQENKNKIMKNQALKNLIKEEIKNILEQDALPKATGSSLARNLRQTSIDLAKDPSGFNSNEAGGIQELIAKMLSKAKEGNISPMIVKRINALLDSI